MTSVTEFLTWLFGGDDPRGPLMLHQAAARALVMSFIGLLIMRMGKSRVLGRATSLDVVVAFVLGSLLSRAITGSASISGTTVACSVIVAAHWVVTALDCRWNGFAHFLKGNAFVVVEDGEILYDDLHSSHISENDLLGELRESGVEDVSEVKRAYKERSGKISVIKRKPEPRVVDVAVEEGVQTVRISLG